MYNSTHINIYHNLIIENLIYHNHIGCENVYTYMLMAQLMNAIITFVRLVAKY